MLSFNLTDEQRSLIETVKKFTQKEIIPIAKECDEKSLFPDDIFKKAHEIGIMNECIPPEYGGVGLSHIDGCLIAEELFAGCAGIGTTIAANTLALTPLEIGGDHYIKENFLKPFSERAIFASFCLTEPESGSDAGSLKTYAEKKGDGYILNGRKCFITNATHASQYTVFAKTNKDGGLKGISCFVVPKEFCGVSTGKKEDKLGQRASDTADVFFENVFVPEKNRIGKEGDGFKIAMKTLDLTRASIAAGSVGIARAALEHAVKYMNERKQFGKPLAEFQGLQFMVAEMSQLIEAARLLTWKSAWMADNNIRNTKESAMAKWLASDVAMRVTTDAVQLFGGYGYSKEYPVEKLMRDAKLCQIYEGTNQIQRLVVARETLMGV